MLLFYVANVKTFMNTLLRGDLFDAFEARGISLQTFTRFEIDCVRCDAPNESAEAEQKTKYCIWGGVKEHTLNIIKGKTPPKNLKIRFCLSGAKAEEIHKNAAALHMTLTYEGGVISVLTGAAQKNFSLDKELDSAWDSHVLSLFAANGFEPRENA